MNGKLSIATTPGEADPPQASNFADSPLPPRLFPDPPNVDDPIPIEVPPFVPEFPVYIFYLGERKHDDRKLVIRSHLEILKSVRGSFKAAMKSLVYSYNHGFSGFAAKLKPAEAEILKNHPEVIIFLENRKLEMQTTQTWDYLGLFSTPTSSKGLLHETNMGSGAIMGVIDSGIWSESGVFDDNGYGPIPKKWKGQCVSGGQFSPADCNRKLIGATYYIDGLNADLERTINSTTEYISPRDHNGHGTEVSSLVAGSFVSNVTFPGLPSGSTMRGGAPKAHIAMYKACWDVEGGMCSVADIWKAFDEAIHDGVDVLSVSIGTSLVRKAIDVEIDIAIPALHAVNKGITVVSPAGNGGPYTSSVINVSPWILTVAATSLDRSFATLITLENNKTLLGESLYTGPEIGFAAVFSSLDNLDQIKKGAVMVYFYSIEAPPSPEIVKVNGGIGVIYVRDTRDRSFFECPENFPCIYMDYDFGTELHFYFETASSPKIKISPYKTIIGDSVASKVGASSGRGPSSFSPAILKPDIAAPGLTLVTSKIPTDQDTSEFAYSGTSMATPVIAGIVALLKISHPDWSPAAIKSALVTTAMKTDPYGERVITDGGNRKEADIFDYGGGLVNMEKATDPGLVYDMDMNDYIQYLCSAALYTDRRVSAITGNVTTKCPTSGSSILDVNVPSITIPNLKGNITVTRTVTNVGPVDSVYTPVIESPFGFDVVVSPEKLVFDKGTNKAKFTVYIVYLGERQHDDPDVVAESHHRMLESVFESPEAARESIIYNYHHGFSGFAAKLTDSQAKKLSDRPDVFQVSQNRNVELQGTRVYDYLGLSPSLPKGILHDSDMGSDIVIGFLDTGIWPESEAYNDKGLGPIPKHWKGECVAGQAFDPAKHCNKKLVGAKYFYEGWKESNPGVKLGRNEFISARDGGLHGTMTSSIAASSFVPNASYIGGLAHGVLRGGAPKARIAMYKVVFHKEFGGIVASVMKAFDEAIKDGVDVLSVSLSSTSMPLRPYTAITEDLEIGAFHAVTKGIPVITGAGNAGPDAYTVSNVAPWLLTVGATSLDRSFHVDLTFGNNITISGQSYYTAEEISGDLVCVEDWRKIPSSVDGKVGLAFVEDDQDSREAAMSIDIAQASAVIIARSSDNIPEDMYGTQVVFVDYEVGSKILQYMHSSSSPTVKITTAKTVVGRPLPTTVSGFSSRGPSSQSPSILKPDIVAPGMMILGAVPGISPYRNKFEIGQGTSYSTPVVASIVALLKALHPDWSPAALKSAIMTTAWKTDPHGQPIFAEGKPRKLADPFDYGAGLVNAERAKDPGLVYDMNLDDYIHYFCASGYNDTSITILTGKQTKCGTPLPSLFDVNYPAITIPDLKERVTATRTVTNVGPVDSVYKAVIVPPKGVKITVEPETLVFNSSTKKLVFKVRVSSSHKSNTGYFFGSFTWTDGTRNVTIPLSARTRVLHLD
ncbi:unnamed protein product [Arabis nemorensis]|uniref:Uncharacterized protein n=1 Tax=Arabis nemorensis TaxID=586526 RepID=A0A565CF51_9BRAS|nr:unnamed protein product [Arabis nemorensis]